MAYREVYTDITIGGDTIEPIAVELSEGHKQTTANFSIETEDIASVGLNDVVTIDIGFVGEHGLLFTGYVDEITETRLPGIYRITGRDILKLAIEHFIVTTDLENPWSRSNIAAEDLVKDLLAEASITNYVGAVTLFSFGVSNPAEFQLMSSWDAVRTICHILAYNCWAENGVVYFDRVFPVPSGAPTHAFNVGNSGDIIMADYGVNTDNLRNKVVVFGRDGIYAEDSAVSPYLPANFYKTAIVSSELIDQQTMADESATYNLNLYNKLTEFLRIEAEGDYRVRCRDTVSVTEPFTGMSATDWFVYSVSHTIRDDSYTMSLNLVK